MRHRFHRTSTLLGSLLATLLAAGCLGSEDESGATSSAPMAGASCTSHSDCGPTERCKKGVCMTKGGCTPSCGDAQCGDDGCGQSCGTCSEGLVCVEGQCASDDDPPTDPPDDDGPRAFPGARGFGTTSPCGRGGDVFVVQDQTDFDACIGHSGPRVCVFAVSGTFSAPSVRDPYLTIAGQSAPSPGVQISPQLDIRTHDVCVLHVRVRGNGQVGDPVHLNHRQEGGQDQTHDIVLDHVSVSWGADENISSYCGPGNAVNGQPGTPDGYVRDVTVSHSISSEGLLGHSMGFLAARPGHENFSVIGNIFAHNNGRNPKLGNGAFVIANNLIYNAGNRGIALGSSGGVFDGYIVGNASYDGPNTKPSMQPLSGSTGNDAMNTLFVDDNADDDVLPNDPQSLMSWQGTNLTMIASPQDWVAPLDLGLIASSEVRDRNLACAGARPLDRDVVDAAIIADIQSGGGAHISTAPALPNLDGGAHTLPDILTQGDPTLDSDGDGYTDVEETLHAMAAALECP